MADVARRPVPSAANNTLFVVAPFPGTPWRGSSRRERLAGAAAAGVAVASTFGWVAGLFASLA